MDKFKKQNKWHTITKTCWAEEAKQICNVRENAMKSVKLLMLWNYFWFLTVCRIDEFISVVFIVQYRQLINKGIEFIDLIIFKDKSVIPSVPNNFYHTVPPTICYKDIKSIRSTINTFNKIVTDMNIHSNTPYS